MVAESELWPGRWHTVKGYYAIEDDLTNDTYGHNEELEIVKTELKLEMEAWEKEGDEVTEITSEVEGAFLAYRVVEESSQTRIMKVVWVEA